MPKINLITQITVPSLQTSWVGWMVQGPSTGQNMHGIGSWSNPTTFCPGPMLARYGNVLPWSHMPRSGCTLAWSFWYAGPCYPALWVWKLNNSEAAINTSTIPCHQIAMGALMTGWYGSNLACRLRVEHMLGLSLLLNLPDCIGCLQNILLMGKLRHRGTRLHSWVCRATHFNSCFLCFSPFAPL